ncbi:MAG: Ig-like domain repeat protein [Thaumarchaeota archaeon]|nr:Ig-like domain repeat protein [Nitrososphaerota archaeon]
MTSLFPSKLIILGAFVLLPIFGILAAPAAAADGSLIFTDSNSTSVSGTQDPTSLAVSPNSLTVNPGASGTLTITVTDTSATPTTPTGTVQFSDSGAGGTFNPASCSLSSATCAVSYAVSSNPPSSVIITATYGGDPAHGSSAGTSTLTVNRLDPTSTTISPSSAALPSNDTLTFSVQVADTSSTPTAPSGTITFSDGHNGGTFNPASCTLPTQPCVATYTSPANPLNVITVNATYSGDSTHSASYALSSISTSMSNGTGTASTSGTPDTTVTSVTANPAAISSGSQATVTASVTDATNPSNSINGMISWSDGGAGGTFTPNFCLLVGNHCAITYTSPPSAGKITITATYAGGPGHSGSSGTALLSLPATAPPASPSTPTQQSQQPPTTPQSTPGTPSTPTQQSQQPPAPSATQPSAQSHAAPTAAPSTSATVHQVVTAPESIFDKIFSMIESIFKKI